MKAQRLKSKEKSLQGRLSQILQCLHLVVLGFLERICPYLKTRIYGFSRVCRRQLVLEESRSLKEEKEGGFHILDVCLKIG